MCIRDSYGGNLPTTPWAKNAEGRGPAWSNSLFEDNAEFGLGMRLTIDKQIEYARELLKSFEQTLSTELVEAILNAEQSDETGIGAQRERVVELKDKLSKSSDTRAKDLISLADNLVKKSVWIIGGDGWGYDKGYGLVLFQNFAPAAGGSGEDFGVGGVIKKKKTTQSNIAG